MKSELSELYQEVILEHANNPRNWGVLGLYWKTLIKECECTNRKCDKKWMVYYFENEIKDGYSIIPIFTTRFHFSYHDISKESNVWGPYELHEDLVEYLATK